MVKDLPKHYNDSGVKCCGNCDHGDIKVQHAHCGDHVIVLCDLYGIVLLMGVCNDYARES